VAGHVSATLDEGTDGDVGGHMSFLLSSTHYDQHGSRQQGAAIRLSPTRGYYGAVDYKGLLIIIEHNPPTHLVATVPRRTSYTTHYGLEDEGADMLRHIIAAAGGPRRSSSFGSAVLITYPPTCAPLPLHYSCDSGTSCCDAQRGL